VTRSLDRRARLQQILLRDGDSCVWCSRAIDTELVAATTEHLVPRIKGGPSWIENEVAACRRCNGERGHTTLAEWADECQRRGWDPNIDVIIRTLQLLKSRIQLDGGMRRARKYLDSQLRRLRRMVDEAKHVDEVRQYE
jgi:hypothetical protein